MVQRGSDQARQYLGFVAGGQLVRGDEIVVARTGQVSRITRIATFDGDLELATCDRAVAIEISDHVDLGRGDTIASRDQPPSVADQFSACIVWLDEAPLLPGRTYWIRAGTQTAAATVTSLKHKIDIDSGDEIAVSVLTLNDIGYGNLATSIPIAFDAYTENRMTGAFVLIDRKTAATVAAGMINFGLFRAANVRAQTFAIDKGKRAHLKAQRACVAWFTGLPGAGKSTIMNLVEQRLYGRGYHTYALDGDNLRLGINRDLGFTDVDRVENIRRAGEVARLMMDAGLIVLCAFVSPFRADREFVRDRIGAGEFVEVFVDAPLDLCIQRDPKGLYAKARAGLVRNVTGIDSPYEVPEHPDVYLDAGCHSADMLADQVVQKLEEYLQKGDLR